MNDLRRNPETAQLEVDLLDPQRFGLHRFQRRDVLRSQFAGDLQFPDDIPRKVFAFELDFPRDRFLEKLAGGQQQFQGFCLIELHQLRNIFHVDPVPVGVGDQPRLHDILRCRRFFPRVLRPLEIDIALFVDQLMCFDAVKRRFHHLADVFGRSEFQVIRIFLHIAVDDPVVEAAELPDMVVVLTVQQGPLPFDGDGGGLRVELKRQQGVQGLLEVDEVFQLAPFVAGKLPSVPVGEQYSPVVAALPDAVVKLEQGVFAHGIRQFDFQRLFSGVSEEIGLRLFDLLYCQLRHGQKFRQRPAERQDSGVAAPAVHLPGIGRSSENHFRMGGKIFIHPHDSGVVRRLNRLEFKEFFPVFRSLLQYQDIRDHFGANLFECGVRQADRGKQGGSRSEVASGIDRLGIHRGGGGQQNRQPARLQRVQCARNAVIVQVVADIIRIVRPDLIERNIADDQIQRIAFNQCFGEIIDDDSRIRIELPHDPP